jgi:ATP-dependent DNA helicase RecG
MLNINKKLKQLLSTYSENETLEFKEAKILKAKKLVEGKRPNLYISSKVAKHTNQEDNYIKLRGIDDAYAKKIMIDYLHEFNRAKRSDFFKVLVDKLPDILNENQKENKVKNYLQELRMEGIIESDGKHWKMAKR